MKADRSFIQQSLWSQMMSAVFDMTIRAAAGEVVAWTQIEFRQPDRQTDAFSALYIQV